MEGRLEIERALSAGHRPQTIICCSEYGSSAKWLNANRAEVVQLSSSLYNQLVYKPGLGSLLAVFPTWEAPTLALSDGPILILEGVEKPGNLGAIMRTCDAVGIHQLVTIGAPLDVFNPNTIRNSRGTLFSMNVFTATNELLYEKLKAHGYLCLAAGFSEKAVDYRVAKPAGNWALVMGAESEGLSSFWMQRADQLVTIPMRGAADSLNVSVAAAVLLYEFTRDI